MEFLPVWLCLRFSKGANVKIQGFSMRRNPYSKKRNYIFAHHG